ncbi:MAG: heme exporter protein CcmD [Gammaproteobacteria bacterium]|nr:heme exporter protein CcmD [Gammaproteobacteria bacterium]MBU1444354.1 heme exporter protein CcmD [Gammaproteobacteria bacterium]
MNWHGVLEFLAMGGYGLYVWGSFGMTAAVIALEWRQLGAARRAMTRGLR